MRGSCVRTDSTGADTAMTRVDPHEAVVAHRKIFEMSSIGELLVGHTSNRDVEVIEFVDHEKWLARRVEEPQPTHVDAVAVALRMYVRHTPIVNRRDPATEPCSSTPVGVALVRSVPEPLDRVDTRPEPQPDTDAWDVIEPSRNLHGVDHAERAFVLNDIRDELRKRAGIA